MQDYRKLNVWRRSHRLALAVYADTQLWTRDGHAWLATQARRAAMSVSANITEGCGARGGKEFARYLRIALASAFELDYHLLFASDAGVMRRARYEALSRETGEVRAMLSVLGRRVADESSSSATPRARATTKKKVT